jgi:hypothetical protein
MPTYNFVDVNTGDVVSEWMKMSEVDSFLESNPRLRRGVDAPGVINHNLLQVKGVKSRPDEGFREVLSKVKQTHPLGTVNTW